MDSIIAKMMVIWQREGGVAIVRKIGTTLKRKATYAHRRYGDERPLSLGKRVFMCAVGMLLGESWSLHASVRRMRRRQESEETIEDVLDSCFFFKGYGKFCSTKPQQIRGELHRFVKIVRESEPETIVELGTARGGTFYTFCRSVPSASTVISVDLPKDEDSQVPLKQFLNAFEPKKDTFFIRASSHEQPTVEELENVLAGDTIDLLYIDADHSYDGVKTDFHNYKHLLADDGMIAFHDVASADGVCQFWNEIKRKYEYLEIVEEPDTRPEPLGIGILSLDR